MNNNSELDLAANRSKLLDLLRARAESLNASPQTEQKTCIENTQEAKHEELNCEINVKQPQNATETDAEYSKPTDAPVVAPPPVDLAPNVILDDLPSDIQRQLLDILDSTSLDAATLQITTKEPYGLGIKTNRSALYRFHKKQEGAKLAVYRDEAARGVAEILKNVDSTDADFTRATSHLIKLRLLEATMTEKTNPNSILALTKSLDRFRAADHAERRLRLAEKKAAAQHDGSLNLAK